LEGAVGQAADGQENPAVKAMQSAIDKDIDAQKFDILNRKDLIQDKKSLLGQLVADRNYSLNEAADLMKAGLYASTSKTLSDASLRQEAAGNKVLAAKYAQAAAALATESAAKRADMNASQVRKVTETETVKLAPKKGFFEGMPESQSGRIVNSITDVKDAERFRDYIEKSKDDTKGLGLISKLYAQARSKFPNLDPADAEKMAKFQADIAKSAKAALGAGTVTDSDIRFGEKLAANYGYDAAANMAILQNRIDSKRSEVNDLISIYSADGRVPSQELLDFVNKSGPKSAGTPDLKPVK